MTAVLLVQAMIRVYVFGIYSKLFVRAKSIHADLHNRTGACLLNFQSGHSSWIFDVQFDAMKIVSASQDQRILIMDFTTGLDTNYF
jgi:hypothetical protein